jgi:hypothetical protein
MSYDSTPYYIAGDSLDRVNNEFKKIIPLYALKYTRKGEAYQNFILFLEETMQKAESASAVKVYLVSYLTLKYMEELGDSQILPEVKVLNSCFVQWNRLFKGGKKEPYYLTLYQNHDKHQLLNMLLKVENNPEKFLKLVSGKSEYYQKLLNYGEELLFVKLLKAEINPDLILITLMKEAIEFRDFNEFAKLIPISQEIGANLTQGEYKELYDMVVKENNPILMSLYDMVLRENNLDEVTVPPVKFSLSHTTKSAPSPAESVVTTPNSRAPRKKWDNSPVVIKILQKEESPCIVGEVPDNDTFDRSSVSSDFEDSDLPFNRDNCFFQKARERISKILDPRDNLGIASIDTMNYRLDYTSDDMLGDVFHEPFIYG